MQDYGHRVRLATHSNFKEFVLTAGLEFYPLGGDPKVLAGCMYHMPMYISTKLTEWPLFISSPAHCVLVSYLWLKLV